MAATYSINVGTSQESETLDTLSSVLSLLPDNTQKLIAPRDVRDAIFSTWERSPLRYTSVSATDYIGIDRSDVKVKIFLGKKELSGTEIMSSTLLSSDTDIFLYNTKSDAGPTQDFKMSFLAGSSASLWTSAPYFESVYVAGGNPYLSLQIVNPNSYGTINIESGASASMSFNGLIWPSQNEISGMIASQSSATTNDLFLVMRSGQYLELRKSSTIGDTLGSPGLTTSIYGSPVNVNGYSLEFTDSTPIVATFGGIALGSTFSNVPLIEMIRQLIYPYLGPLSSLSITTTLSSNYSYERDHVSPVVINFDYLLTRRSDDITSSLIRVQSPSAIISSFAGATLSGNGFTYQSYGSSASISGAQISANTSLGTFTFSVSCYDGTTSFTSSVNVNFVYPYFYGFYATSSFSAASVNNSLSALSKNIDVDTNQTLSLSGTGYLYFMYPSSYGALYRIYDGNNFLLFQSGSSSSWTYSTVSGIQSPDGKWTSATYRVYKTTTSVTVPIPSEDYKFNFS